MAVNGPREPSGGSLDGFLAEGSALDPEELVFEDGPVIRKSLRSEAEHVERGEVFQFHVGVDLGVLLF